MVSNECRWQFGSLSVLCHDQNHRCVIGGNTVHRTVGDIIDDVAAVRLKVGGCEVGVDGCEVIY